MFLDDLKNVDEGNQLDAIHKHYQEQQNSYRMKQYNNEVEDDSSDSSMEDERNTFQQ